MDQKAIWSMIQMYSGGSFCLIVCELKPGESKTIPWDQNDTEGNQVKTGTYSAKTSSATEENSNNTSPIATSTTFTKMNRYITAVSNFMLTKFIEDMCLP